MLSGNKSFFSYFTKKNACNNKVVNNKPVEKIKPKSLRKISKEIKIHEYSTEDFLFLKFKINYYPIIDERKSEDDKSI